MRIIEGAADFMVAAINDHEYLITGPRLPPGTPGGLSLRILFQSNGSVLDSAINGVTEAAVLAVLIDHMSLRHGNPRQDAALEYCEKALECLQTMGAAR